MIQRKKNDAEKLRRNDYSQRISSFTHRLGKEFNEKKEQLEARLNQEEKLLLDEIEDAFYKTQGDIEKIVYLTEA